MTKFNKQMVVVEQAAILPNQQTETLALFNPDGTPWTPSGSSPPSSAPTFDFDNWSQGLIHEGNISADDSNHSISTWVTESSVDWIDNDGKILLPGMYRFGLELSMVTSPTTPGKWGVAGFIDSNAFSLDGLNEVVKVNTQSVSPTISSAILSLPDTSLPWTQGAFIIMPEDATAVVNVAMVVSRLLIG